MAKITKATGVIIILFGLVQLILSLLTATGFGSIVSGLKISGPGQNIAQNVISISALLSTTKIIVEALLVIGAGEFLILVSDIDFKLSNR